MKIHFAVALAGLAIGFALPTFAEQKDTVDPKVAQQVRALSMKLDDAFNRQDATTLAAFYTEDAVRATTFGHFRGRQAIEKGYVKYDFQQFHSSNCVTVVDRVIAVGDEIRSIGKYSCNFTDYTGVPRTDEGRFSSVVVRDGDTWKIRRSTTKSSFNWSNGVGG
jgi:uncharacterized protein (TIGR02246 family)